MVVAKGGIALGRFCASREIVVAKGGIALGRFCASREIVVAKGGIEPPTHGFSVRCSTN
jgi:hypothetical protein